MRIMPKNIVFPDRQPRFSNENSIYDMPCGILRYNTFRTSEYVLDGTTPQYLYDKQGVVADDINLYGAGAAMRLNPANNAVNTAPSETLVDISGKGVFHNAFLSHPSSIASKDWECNIVVWIDGVWQQVQYFSKDIKLHNIYVGYFKPLNVDYSAGHLYGGMGPLSLSELGDPKLGIPFYESLKVTVVYAEIQEYTEPDRAPCAFTQYKIFTGDK